MIAVDLNKSWKNGSSQFGLNVKFEIESNEFLCIYGASGAGKTSILRMLAGLTNPDKGKIEVDGKNWFDSSAKLNLQVQSRKIGYVFQEYALFPNMTVQQNLLYAAGSQKKSSFLEELIEVSEIRALLDRKPSTLSGGQQQRVALVRALAREPKLLLLDEPLSALDSAIRYKLQSFLIDIHRRFDIAIIMVTHDVSEVFRLSTKLLQIGNGDILKFGKASDLFSKSKISGKFQFTGEILKMEKQDVVFIVSVLVGQELVKVVATESEASNLMIGDKVLVASKAFNPLIQKIIS
jgi:molybdate transport system ATP-binding protein